MCIYLYHKHINTKSGAQLLTNDAQCKTQYNNPLATVLNYTDWMGYKHTACLVPNPGSKPGRELPLVVWLNPSEVSAQNSFLFTQWQNLYTTQLLNNEDSSKIGFSFLLPEGRNTHHSYPAPDNEAVGWDNWYRNLDREDPHYNVDAAAIDNFIKQTKHIITVDSRRIFLSGWSNGKLN